MISLPQKDILRPDEVANYYQVSTQTVRRWIWEGRLKAVKVGGVIRIHRKEALKIEKKMDN